MMYAFTWQGGFDGIYHLIADNKNTHPYKLETCEVNNYLLHMFLCMLRGREYVQTGMHSLLASVHTVNMFILREI